MPKGVADHPAHAGSMVPTCPSSVTGAVCWASLRVAGLDCCPAARCADAHPAKLLGVVHAILWQDQHGRRRSREHNLRTRDGYRWLGTVDGVRFYGVRFTAFDPINTPEIGAGGVLALLEDRAGDFVDRDRRRRLTRRRGPFHPTPQAAFNDHVICLLERPRRKALGSAPTA